MLASDSVETQLASFHCKTQPAHHCIKSNTNTNTNTNINININIESPPPEVHACLWQQAGPHVTTFPHCMARPDFTMC